MSADRLARLKKYAARRHAIKSSIDPEMIHSFDLGEPSEAELLLSDLDHLLARVDRLKALLKDARQWVEVGCEFESSDTEARELMGHIDAVLKDRS